MNRGVQEKIRRWCAKTPSPDKGLGFLTSLLGPAWVQARGNGRGYFGGAGGGTGFETGLMDWR